MFESDDVYAETLPNLEQDNLPDNLVQDLGKMSRISPVPFLCNSSWKTSRISCVLKSRKEDTIKGQ